MAELKKVETYSLLLNRQELEALYFQLKYAVSDLEDEKLEPLDFISNHEHIFQVISKTLGK